MTPELFLHLPPAQPPACCAAWGLMGSALCVQDEPWLCPSQHPFPSVPRGHSPELRAPASLAPCWPCLARGRLPLPVLALVANLCI